MTRRLRDLFLHLGFELDMALQSDGEHGSHELNNRKAAEWGKENPELTKWLSALRKKVDDAVCPECGGSGILTSEAQARTPDPISHKCQRCHGGGLKLDHET